jgi:hypothetical protein
VKIGEFEDDDFTIRFQVILHVLVIRYLQRLVLKEVILILGVAAFKKSLMPVKWQDFPCL